MASRSLFQALLLAASLGWNGVYAQDQYNNNTTSSAEQTLFAPVVGVSQTSLVIPTYVTSQHPIAQTPVTGHTAISLEGPSSLSSSSTSRPTVYPSPATQHTESSLDVPTSPQTETPTVAESPATGHTQTSLQVPTTRETTPIAPIVVTAKSQTTLDVPTGRPTVGVPPEQGDDGEPTRLPVHDGDGGRPGENNPGGIIASLVHEHSQQWSGGDQPAQQTTEAPAAGSTYQVMGTQIAAGASAATIGGTTYSLAPSGEGIYVNGQPTTFEGPVATDSVAMAVMSALGGDTTPASGIPMSESRTMATTASDRSSSAQGSETGTAGVAEQTGNGADLIIPGVGLGLVGFVMAVL